MTEGVERAVKRRVRPVGFHINISCMAVKNYGRTSWRSGKRKHWNMAKAPWPRYRSRWKTAGEDQRIGELSLFSWKRWTCGKVTNLVPLECSTELLSVAPNLPCISDDWKKQGVRDKSCIGSWLSNYWCQSRQPQRFLVFSVCRSVYMEREFWIN